MSTKNIESNVHRPPPAPVEFAGQWVAWNREQTTIIAHGANLVEVLRSAATAGHPNAVLQKVRRTKETFIGAI